MPTQELLQQVVLVSKSQLFQAITLADPLLREPELLFNLFDQLQGGIVEYLGEFSPQESLASRIAFEIEAECDSKELGVWLSSFIVRQVALYFTEGTGSLASICQQHRSQ